MSNEADINITCRQCGKEFVFTKAEQDFYELQGFTFPRRCRECRSVKQAQPSHQVCAQCGTELEKGAAVYCATCLESVRNDFEQKTTKCKKVANEAHTKLLASESQRAQLTESLRQTEQLVADLQEKVDSLSQELDQANQFQGGLQPALTIIAERLESLEHSQNRINERMLQLAQRMHEMYESTSLSEILKRSLRRYQNQQGT